jgi:hypothetical protein
MNMNVKRLYCTESLDTKKLSLVFSSRIEEPLEMEATSKKI